MSEELKTIFWVLNQPLIVLYQLEPLSVMIIGLYLTKLLLGVRKQTLGGRMRMQGDLFKKKNSEKNRKQFSKNWEHKVK